MRMYKQPIIKLTKIVIERVDGGVIANFYADKHINVEYTSKDGMTRMEGITQNETTVYPFMIDHRTTELFEWFAKMVDTIEEKPAK